MFSGDQSKSDPIKLKLIVVGDAPIGKTALISQFTNGDFSPSYMATIGVDFKIKELTVYGKPFVLQIWDTAGQERFRSITRSYYKGSGGVLIVCDLTSRSSFESLMNSWLPEIKSGCDQDIPIILVGNKSDLLDQQEVNYYELQDFAGSQGLSCVFTSAKTGKNVEEAFSQLVQLVASKTSAPSETKPAPKKENPDDDCEIDGGLFD